jgi:serine/threonine-protein kinase
MTRPPELAPSAVPDIGKYHVVAELGRGGMGVVYLAAVQGPAGFRKLVVVKELKPEMCDDEVFVTMFLEEARLAARLIHPNIVQTNEVGTDGSRHFMVMEFLDGRSLHRCCRQFVDRDQFAIGAHLRIIAETLHGLHHAHELTDYDGRWLGIIHRDVSPLNVFVTFDGQTKLLDFGIAKAADSSLETRTGILKGRIAYMAPEQAMGATTDRRADIYSIGVMIWEAAAGRRMWQSMSDVQVLGHMLGEGPPSLRAAQPDVPRDLEKLCMRALAKRPEDRQASAAELLDELEAHMKLRDDCLSMREIGVRLSEAFADERRRTSGLIEAAIRRPAGGPQPGSVPKLYSGTSGTYSFRGLAEDLAAVSGTHPVTRAGVNSQGPIEPVNRSLEPMYDVSVDRWDFFPRTRLMVTALGALIGIGVLGIGVYLAAQSSGSKRDPVVTAATSALVDMRPLEPPLEFVELSVRVAPSTATISIDGNTTSINPFHGHFRKDMQVHHVVAFADGYEAKSADVSFSTDTSVVISLNRHVAAAAPVRPLVRSVGVVPRIDRIQSTSESRKTPADLDTADSPPSRTEIRPAGGRVPLRPIMTSDPYGNP